MLKRVTLLFGLSVACQLAAAPQTAEAHGWRSRCGSYYNSSSYCSPQSSYYSTYNNCSPYYSNYGPSYGPSPYSSNPYGPLPQYNNFGTGFGGLGAYGGPSGFGGVGGGSLMWPMGTNFPAGANLAGSLLQPSYLSMPVGVGYGGSGYLQIPVGNPAGRTSYLQIPVNSGYGPPSYLQIELGRNPGSRDTPAPGPSPLGSVPGVNIPPVDRVAYDIPKTATDDVPPVVPAVQGNSVQAIAAVGNNVSRAKISTAADKHFEANVTTQCVKSQFVFIPKAVAPTPNVPQTSGLPRTKDTSFSLIGDDIQAPPLVALDRDSSTADELPTVASRVSELWAASK